MAKANRAEKKVNKPSSPKPKQDRKPKVFSESLGLNHLLQLSNEIASKQEDKLQSRIDKAKDKRAWQKERNIRKNGGGGGGNQISSKKDGGWKQRDNMIKKNGGDNQQKSVVNTKPLTKSSIRAGLVAAQREKSKMRKDARKAAKKASTETSSSSGKVKDASIQAGEGTTDRIERPAKRVSFAA